MKIKAINIPLYRGKLVIIITDSAKQVKKHIPEFDDAYLYAHSYWAKFKKSQGYYIILNFKNPYRKIHHGTIAHEAVHTAHFIMKDRGIIDSFENDEAKAYLVEWITDQVYKVIKNANHEVK